MSRSRVFLCAVLMVGAAAAVASVRPGLAAYTGWPAGGLAIGALLLVPRHRLLVAAAALAALTAIGIGIGFGRPWWFDLPAGLTVAGPALLARLILRDLGFDGASFTDDGEVPRYHVAVATYAICSAVLVAAFGLANYSAWEASLLGLATLLSAATSAQVSIPLFYRGHRLPAAGTRLELHVQRLLLAVVGLLVFGLASTPGFAVLLIPFAAWGAMRATRLEAQLQLVVLAVVVYGCTVAGLGPFAHPPAGLPGDAVPVLVNAFVAACAYTVVPMSSIVERLSNTKLRADQDAFTIQRMLESASATVFIAVDSKGRITHFNRGAETTLGWTSEEMLGHYPLRLHPPGEVERQAGFYGVPAELGRVIQASAASSERRDWHFVRKDGEHRLLSLSLSPVLDDSRAVIGYIAAGEDVTERQRAHDALRTALEREHAAVQRLREIDRVKQDLVSNVSHELRTPITSIAGYSELLSDGALGDLSAQQAEVVARIERNTTRLTLLVEDLLTLSRAESGQLGLERGHLDLREIAREAMELAEDFAVGRELHLHLDPDPTPVRVHADAREVERVLINLISNAVKFTPDGGTVEVAVSHGKAMAEVRVRDTGIGIPAHEQEQLFTPFFRSSSATDNAIQGTGLGLSIVKALILQHGGDVEIVSDAEHGTEVTVRLPYDLTPAARRSTENAPQRGA